MRLGPGANRKVTAGTFWGRYYKSKNKDFCKLFMAWCEQTLEPAGELGDRLGHPDNVKMYRKKDLFEKAALLREIKHPESYITLGVWPDTPMPAIRKRYKELASRYHPDTGGDTEKFQEIAKAYRKIKLKGDADIKLADDTEDA